jgi:hypothetical protein
MHMARDVAGYGMGGWAAGRRRRRAGARGGPAGSCCRAGCSPWGAVDLWGWAGAGPRTTCGQGVGGGGGRTQQKRRGLGPEGEWGSDSDGAAAGTKGRVIAPNQWMTLRGILRLKGRVLAPHQEAQGQRDCPYSARDAEVGAAGGMRTQNGLLNSGPFDLSEPGPSLREAARRGKAQWVAHKWSLRPV